MTTQDWLQIEPVYIEIDILEPSQPHIHDHLLSGPDTSYCKDIIVHVVHYQDKYYIVDGHHRVARACLRGDKAISVRLHFKDSRMNSAV